MSSNDKLALVPVGEPVSEVFSASQMVSSFTRDSHIQEAVALLKSPEKQRILLKGLVGSSASVAAAALHQLISGIHLVVLNDKESAVYFCNDLENLLGDTDENFHRRHVLFYPTSYKKPYEPEKTDNSNVLMRTEVLKRITTRGKDTIIVTYPEALTEKVVNRQYLEKSTRGHAQSQSYRPFRKYILRSGRDILMVWGKKGFVLEGLGARSSCLAVSLCQFQASPLGWN